MAPVHNVYAPSYIFTCSRFNDFRSINGYLIYRKDRKYALSIIIIEGLHTCIRGVVTGQVFRYLPDHFFSKLPERLLIEMGGACWPCWQIESHLTSTVPGYSDHTMIEIAMHVHLNFTFRINQERSPQV